MKAIRFATALQDDEFDFPCSAAFRDSGAEQRAKMRSSLPQVPTSDTEESLLRYIHELEDENFKLRVALDFARVAQGHPARQRPDRLSDRFAGVEDERDD